MNVNFKGIGYIKTPDVMPEKDERMTLAEFQKPTTVIREAIEKQFGKDRADITYLSNGRWVVLTDNDYVKVKELFNKAMDKLSKNPKSILWSPKKSDTWTLMYSRLVRSICHQAEKQQKIPETVIPGLVEKLNIPEIKVIEGHKISK